MVATQPPRHLDGAQHCDIPLHFRPDCFAQSLLNLQLTTVTPAASRSVASEHLDMHTLITSITDVRVAGGFSVLPFFPVRNAVCVRFYLPVLRKTAHEQVSTTQLDVLYPPTLYAYAWNCLASMLRQARPNAPGRKGPCFALTPALTQRSRNIEQVSSTIKHNYNLR